MAMCTSTSDRTRLSRTACTLFLAATLIVVAPTDAQVDTTGSARPSRDSSSAAMNVDAIYDRPLSRSEDFPVAIGGYAEANSEYIGTDGVTEGLSFQMRRVTIFLASSIRDRMHFLLELEFEDGAREIAVETALMDLELTPLLVLRGGVLLIPIGAFNQNHDGPKWEFIDRPVSATRMLPATWSNVGFGAHGKMFDGDRTYGYEIYITNGFDDAIISNPENRTFLPASKADPNRFEESHNGVPLLSAKVAFKQRYLGEIGVSYMGGVYNTFEEDGLSVDEKRRLDVFALDVNGMLPWIGTSVTAEASVVSVDVPVTYSQQFGRRQWGGFVDLVRPVYRGNLFGFDGSVINAALRLEYVDWNVGSFAETGGDLGDEFASVVPSISWRPSGRTVVRLNYRYEWHTDLFRNPVSKRAGFQFGFSTYF